jgi:hypothetical protein
MFSHHPILFEWLRASSVFALLLIAGALSVDLLLTSGLQLGADPVSGASIIAGTLAQIPDAAPPRLRRPPIVVSPRRTSCQWDPSGSWSSRITS